MRVKLPATFLRLAGRIAPILGAMLLEAAQRKLQEYTPRDERLPPNPECAPTPERLPQAGLKPVRASRKSKQADTPPLL
jgi:hypothetical protein